MTFSDTGFVKKVKLVTMENEDLTLKELQEELNRRMAAYNTNSNPEIDNLSPLDLLQILYNTFGEESPIGFKETVPAQVLGKIPFLNLFEEYLTIIDNAKELKLTTRGNLPRKVCLDLYGKGIIKEEFIESGITKLSKEGDSIVLQNLKIIGNLSGITKKRNNKISLTKKGIKLFDSQKRTGLFKEIFTTNYQHFNLGFHDGYPQEVGIQRTFGYLLYLLLRYGQEKRELNFYANKKLMAFPFELENFEERWSSREDQYENCLGVRMFERFLNYYGLIDYHVQRRYKSDRKTELQTTPIFESIFKLKTDKFQFKNTGHYA